MKSLAKNSFDINTLSKAAFQIDGWSGYATARCFSRGGKAVLGLGSAHTRPWPHVVPLPAAPPAARFSQKSINEKRARWIKVVLEELEELRASRARYEQGEGGRAVGS